MYAVILGEPLSNKNVNERETTDIEPRPYIYHTVGIINSEVVAADIRYQQQPISVFNILHPCGPVTPSVDVDLG